MEFVYLRIKTGANAGYGVDQTMKKGQGTGNDVKIVGICSKGLKDHMVPLVNNVAMGLIEQNNVSLRLGYDGLNSVMVLPAPVGEFMMKQLEHKNTKKESDE